jgi:hypothetical protein
MLWTWLPYRKTTHAGVRYVRGDCDLESLQEVIQASIDSIEKVLTGSDESLVALKEWREMASLAANGKISESQFAEWIVYQDTGFPPPITEKA